MRGGVQHIVQRARYIANNVRNGVVGDDGVDPNVLRPVGAVIRSGRKLRPPRPLTEAQASLLAPYSRLVLTRNGATWLQSGAGALAAAARELRGLPGDEDVHALLEAALPRSPADAARALLQLEPGDDGGDLGGGGAVGGGGGDGGGAGGASALTAALAAAAHWAAACGIHDGRWWRAAATGGAVPARGAARLAGHAAAALGAARRHAEGAVARSSKGLGQQTAALLVGSADALYLPYFNTRAWQRAAGCSMRVPTLALRQLVGYLAAAAARQGVPHLTVSEAFSTRGCARCLFVPDAGPAGQVYACRECGRWVSHRDVGNPQPNMLRYAVLLAMGRLTAAAAAGGAGGAAAAAAARVIAASLGLPPPPLGPPARLAGAAPAAPGGSGAGSGGGAAPHGAGPGGGPAAHPGGPPR